MGWVTLTLRKQSLNAGINELELQDIQLSRQLRASHRHKNYEMSIFNADKTKELREAKEPYMEIRNKRNNIEAGSKAYENWKQEYANAQEDYQAKKQDIEDYYESLIQDLEDESTEEEQRIQDQQAEIEAELQAMKAELETVNEQIKSDMDRQKISFS